MIPMKPTPLSQLAVVSAGQGAPKDNEFSESGVPFVRAGSLDALLSGKNESELELVSPETAKLRKLKTYPKGTILFAKSGMSATKDRVYVLRRPAHVVSHLATLIPKDGANVDYLRLALKRFPPSSLIKDPAYPAIGLGEIENFEIPVPEEFDDQIRIAHLLGKVEGLIAKRKQNLQQLDDLLKSVFLEMFGDPVRNEKGWNTPTLIEVAYFENGDRSSKYPSGPDLVDDGILFLSTKNIVNNRLNLDSKVFITQEKFESLSRGKATAGDVLITLRGTLGSCCIYDSDKYLQAFINAQMMIMRPKALIHSIYLHAFITSATIAGLLQRIGNGAAVPQLTATQLKALRIPLPPPELQEEFAATAEKIETIKSHYQQSLTDLEALYGALGQQAFKGELDLSRVAMPAAPIEGENPLAAAVPALITTPVIELPESDLLMPALQDRTQLAPLLRFWLEDYRKQLGCAAFSLERFIAAAQTRLAELHPDNDFELSTNDYEHIKTWVFNALAAGTLTQAFDDADNRIELKAPTENNPA